MLKLNDPIITAISNKYEKASNTGGWITFETSIKNDGDFGRLYDIATFFRGVTEKDGMQKRHAVYAVSGRRFNSPTDARGYFCAYFSFLTLNNIICYDRKKKIWYEGPNLKRYMADVQYVRNCYVIR